MRPFKSCQKQHLYSIICKQGLISHPNATISKESALEAHKLCDMACIAPAFETGGLEWQSAMSQ